MNKLFKKTKKINNGNLNELIWGSGWEATFSTFDIPTSKCYAMLSSVADFWNNLNMVFFFSLSLIFPTCGFNIRRLHGNISSSQIIVSLHWSTHRCDSLQVHAAVPVLETAHTFSFALFLATCTSVFRLTLFLSVSSLPQAFLSLLKTHIYTQDLSCARLPFPAEWCSFAFMRYQSWACGSMTDCLVERTEEPFCVPPPRWIPFKIFIHKLLEPFTPHQTLDP